MADVGFFICSSGSSAIPALPAPHARPAKGKRARASCSLGGGVVMRLHPSRPSHCSCCSCPGGLRKRSAPIPRPLAGLAGAQWPASVSRQKNTLIGEVLVRFSKAGDFELTFTKGPGVALLEIRQDANFFSVKGPLAGVQLVRDHRPRAAPAPRLAPTAGKTHGLGDKTSLTHSDGGETFIFRF